MKWWRSVPVFLSLQKKAMKNNFKITMMLAAIGAAAITVFLIRRNNTRKMLTSVADEGYETAPDILFPGKARGSKLHYGPVIPDTNGR